MFYAAFKTILTEKKSVCFKSKDTSGANNCDFIAPRWFLYCHKTRRKYLYGKHGSPQGKCNFILYHFFISYCHKLGGNIYVTSTGSPQGKCNFAKVVVVCCFLSQTAVKQLIKTRANENCLLSMKKVKLFKPAKTSKAWVKFRCNSGQNNVI